MERYRLDTSRMPSFQSWKSGFGDHATLTPWNYVDAHASVELVAACATMFWPLFVVERDCVILQEHFVQKTFDEWYAYFHGDRSATEAMLNHVHLVDVFLNQPGSEYADESYLFAYIAQIMAKCWQCALQTQFPERRLQVTYDENESGNGPTVTCFQIEDAEARTT